MSRWQLHVPHRSRDDSLVEVASIARHLEGARTARSPANWRWTP